MASTGRWSIASTASPVCSPCGATRQPCWSTARRCAGSPSTARSRGGDRRLPGLGAICDHHTPRHWPRPYRDRRARPRAASRRDAAVARGQRGRPASRYLQRDRLSVRRHGDRLDTTSSGSRAHAPVRGRWQPRRSPSRCPASATTWPTGPIRSLELDAVPAALPRVPHARARAPSRGPAITGPELELDPSSVPSLSLTGRSRQIAGDHRRP